MSALPTVRVEIRSRRDSERVLYTADVDESVPSGLRMRHALEAATKSGAYLSGANLSGANLSGADLSDAYLSGADSKKLLLVGDRPVLSIGPIGSRHDMLIAFLTDAGIYLRAGCFFGPIDAFRSAVDETHGANEHGREYAAALVLIEAHAAIWMPTQPMTEAA